MPSSLDKSETTQRRKKRAASEPEVSRSARAKATRARTKAAVTTGAGTTKTAKAAKATKSTATKVSKATKSAATKVSKATKSAAAKVSKTSGTAKSTAAKVSKSDAPRAKARRVRSLEIREMELEDLPKVYLLGEKLFTAELWPNLYRTWDEYELVEFFASAQEYCYVAESDGRIQGFILGTVIEKRHSAWNYGWVVWLGVSPRAKGQGVGRKLVDKLTDVFIEDGVRILLVDTDAKNENAIQFFERLGFGSKNHHVYMTRNLTRDPRYTEHKQHEEVVERDLRRRRKKLLAAKRVRTQARTK